MDDVIDFTALSLALPDIADTPTSSSDTSASMFSTPLLTSSGSTGGDRFGSSVGLYYCQEVNTNTSPCGGVIANSGYNRFCLRINCKVKSHRLQKVKLEAGKLYILGARKEQALLEPLLDVSSLPQGTDSSVLADISKPSTVWKAFFITQMECKDQSSTVDSPSETSWEDLESPLLDKLSSVTSSYVTPKKLKVGFLLEAFADSIPIGLGKASELTELPDLSGLVDDPLKQAQAEAMIVILSEWNTLRGNFETFDDKFSKLGEGEKKYRDAISETVMKIHDAIRDTDARTSLMVAHLGHDQTEASSLGQIRFGIPLDGSMKR
jgi:hypothetical protein